MNLKEMDETLAFAEVDNAVAQGTNVVFFCYTPHAHVRTCTTWYISGRAAYDPEKWRW